MSEALKGFLDEVMPVVVGTNRSDGSVQMNPVWYERRDDEIWLNAAASRAWGKRLEEGTPLTLLFVDPNDQWRWAQVQTEVIDKTAVGAEHHIDRLSRRYRGQGYAWHDATDPRLIVRLRVTRVTGSVNQKAA